VPAVPSVSDLGSTPEAVIARASNAIQRRDMTSFVDCLTPEAKISLAAFSVSFDIRFDQSSYKSMADASPAIREKFLASQKKRPYVQQLAAQGITADHIAALPDEKDPGFKAALKDMLRRAKDPGALVVAQLKESIERNTKPGETPTVLGWDVNAQVQNLRINGDRAFGRITTTHTFNGIKEDTPIYFERNNNLWKISLEGRVHFSE
jgi:hypothetical protein